MFDRVLDFFGLDTSDSFTIIDYIAVIGGSIMFLVLAVYFYRKSNWKTDKQQKLALIISAIFFVYTFLHSISLVTNLIQSIKLNKKNGVGAK